MDLKALSKEIHKEQGEEKKFQPSPLPTDMPIRIDMTIGDTAARIVKVKHQGVEETVRILNNVLRKMNSDMKLELMKNGVPVKIPENNGNSDSEDAAGMPLELMDFMGEEPTAGIERS